VSLFNSLGYVTIQTGDIERWRRFAFKLIGFAEGTGPDPNALYLRMDERAARIVVTPGDTDRIVAAGWEVRDRAALARVRETLDAAGVPYEQLSQNEADDRRVEEVIAFDDPAGNTLEVFHGAVLDHSPVVTPFGARRHWMPTVCSSSTPRHWVSYPAARSGYRCPKSSGPFGFASSESTNATTAWRSPPR